MRRPIVIGAAVAALAAGGTAVAAPGVVFHDDPKEHQAELARDLAANLDGVTAAEVRQALEKVHEQRMADHREQLARALASKLDGLTVTQVEQALEKVHEQLVKSHEAGERPDPQAFVEALAKELGKSEDQVREALQAVHRDRIEARLDAAVKAGRITERQADEIRERIEQGGPGHGPWLGGPHGIPRGPGSP
jgi:hypothetical protein